MSRASATTNAEPSTTNLYEASPMAHRVRGTLEEIFPMAAGRESYQLRPFQKIREGLASNFEGARRKEQSR